MVATREKKTQARRAPAADKPKATRARKVEGNGSAAMKGSMSNEDRYRMVAEAAYYLAEAGGFDPARNMDNWLEAERRIAQSLK